MEPFFFPFGYSSIPPLPTQKNKQINNKKKQNKQELVTVSSANDLEPCPQSEILVTSRGPFQNFPLDRQFFILCPHWRNKQSSTKFFHNDHLLSSSSVTQLL